MHFGAIFRDRPTARAVREFVGSAAIWKRRRGSDSHVALIYIWCIRTYNRHLFAMGADGAQLDPVLERRAETNKEHLMTKRFSIRGASNSFQRQRNLGSESLVIYSPLRHLRFVIL